MIDRSRKSLDAMRDKQHSWVPSKLGHGELMCSRCFVTDREAAVLGIMNECNTPSQANAWEKSEALAVRLRNSVHKVITEYTDSFPPCPDNERKLFAVQMTQADLDIIIKALMKPVVPVPNV